MTMASAVIHVVDDDAPFRKAMGRLLKASGYQVALYDSGERLLERPPGAEPGCILLDLRMDGLSGLEVQRRLAQSGHTLPIVFLTGQGDIPASVQAIKAGAEDFLSKPVGKRPLLDAVARALARQEQAREQNERLGAQRALVATLTPRESEVLALVVRGKLNKQIAYALGASERTVKAHRHSIMLKLHAPSLAELVVIAERLGILAAPSAAENHTRILG